MTPLKFNLKVSSIPVTLEGSGGTEDYELREMTAAARDAYLDTLGDRFKTGPDGKPSGIKKFEGMQADLVARSLFSKAGKPVPKDIVQTWPSSVVVALFKEAQLINHLTEGEKEMVEASKNE